MVGRRSASALLFAMALAVVVVMIPVAPARAARTQVSIFQDDPRLDADPAGTLARLRLLGAQVARVSVSWKSIAPAPNALHPPRGFDPADPAAYPAGNWRLWDAIVREAHWNGITVDFDLMGGAPRWALGPGRPAGNRNPNWEPSAAAFGAFVRAVGTRYSGTYDPGQGRSLPGDPADLPGVRFWSVWNEPNYGPSLAPQGLPGDRRIENSPRMYRNLLGAAWNALQATGHGAATDTILFGELAPRGQARWGLFSGMTPLAFLRALYCVDAGYHPLRGTAARIRGCPATAAASSRFRAQNPALFAASGVADHPYMRWYAPNHEFSPDPTNDMSTGDYASLGVIGNLSRTLDRLVDAYGSHRRLPIYDTEFGYITSPPKHSPDSSGGTTVFYLSPAVAAAYINWAEYISWRNPRLRSFDQYLLYDPARPTRANDWGGFASGVLSWTGAPKATFDAWRLPLYLPVTSARPGQALEVWGCIRPAPDAARDTGQPQSAKIQFAPARGRRYTTLATVIVGAGASCYFDRRLAPRASGTLRLAYTYPDGLRAFSRAVAITVR